MKFGVDNMKLSAQIKCAICLRRSCPARYKIGSRAYYSYLGFTSIECPKKLEKEPFLRNTKQLNSRLTEQSLKSAQNCNMDNNDKNEE